MMTTPLLYWPHLFIARLRNSSRIDKIKRMRGWHYSYLLGGSGKNLRIADHVRINNPSMVFLGDDCYLGSDVQLYAWNERITIGNNVLIAAGVRMITRKHGFAEIDTPISKQGYTNEPIVIEDDVWIGFQAVLLPGITIGKGSIIGASAVVTKDVPPYTIMGGIPARPIRQRIPSDERCQR